MEKEKKLIIFGNSAYAKLVDYYLTSDSPYEVVAFCVDDEFKDSSQFLGRPLISSSEILNKFPPSDFAAIVAIGYSNMNKLRAEKFFQLSDLGYNLPAYVSRHSTYLSQEPPGPNTIIMEDNVIQPFTKVGANVVFWSGNHLGHESAVKDHAFISSHCVIAGFSTINEYCFLGGNCVVRDNISVSEGTLVGAGTVISKSTKPWRVYAPARSYEVPKVLSTRFL